MRRIGLAGQLWYKHTGTIGRCIISSLFPPGFRGLGFRAKPTYPMLFRPVGHQVPDSFSGCDRNKSPFSWQAHGSFGLRKTGVPCLSFSSWRGYRSLRMLFFGILCLFYIRIHHYFLKKTSRAHTLQLCSQRTLRVAFQALLPILLEKAVLRLQPENFFLAV